MPEYLAPGVYVEETSFRSKSIEGVSTTTTGFVGPARYGPISIEPDVITSVMEFERIYGDREQLRFDSGLEMDNYLWHGARAFFEEGGKRLYIARVFLPLHDSSKGDEKQDYVCPNFEQGGTKDGQRRYFDGHARTALKDTTASKDAIRVTARFPGAAGNVRVRFTLRAGQNVLAPAAGGTATVAVQDKDVVIIHRGAQSDLYTAESYYDEAEQRQTWKFTGGSGGDVLLKNLTADPDPKQTDIVRIVTIAVTVTPAGRAGSEMSWDGLALDPRHRRAGTPDSLFDKFCAKPTSMDDARTLPIVITRDNSVSSGITVLQTLFAAQPGPDSPPAAGYMSLSDAVEAKPLANDPKAQQPSLRQLSLEFPLAGGNDGQRPGAGEYAGKEDDQTKTKTGLVALEDIEDISIVAAPGSTFRLEDGYRGNAAAIVNSLVAHATKMRYRIAVLDSGEGQTISQVRAMRGKIDSSYAALYYPWVRVLDPVTGTEKNMPPSGFVAGIYARNDITRAVYKAPANEVVMSALGFELLLNKSQQDVLNPEGINCFRFFEGRGFRLWGARTASSDPEWKYVNLRRYFAYLEHSIDRGTQWAVFEPNGEALWSNVRRTIEDFLLNEWQMGALLGEKPDKSFFVKCDRTTMSQNDLDNGRLVCLIGVAPLRPAEFVIFRIGQWTADRKV